MRIASATCDHFNNGSQTPDFLGCCGSEDHNRFVYFMAEIRDTKWFQGTVILFIVLAGVMVGVQTYDITDSQSI